ncbi:MAG: HD domain-containing protein [Desulfobacterales bacterium]
MIRLLLNIILVLAVFLSCYLEEAILSLRPPQAGQRTFFTLRLLHQKPAVLPLEAPSAPGVEAAPQPSPTAPVLPGRWPLSGPWVIAAGETIIPFLHVLEEQDVRRIEAANRPGGGFSTPFFLFTMIFVAGFLALFRAALPQGRSRRTGSQNLVLTLLVLHLLLMKALLLFTPLPAYMLPFGLLPLLMVGLNQSRALTVGAAVAASILSALYVDPNFTSLIALLVAGLTAALAANAMTRATEAILPGILIGAANAAVFSVVNFADWQAMAGQVQAPSGLFALSTLATQPVVVETASAFGGAFLAGLLAPVLLPFLRATRYLSTTLKLRRFADLDHPALKRLFNEAPGTYQHSLGVAYLAQSAGDATGADALLLRIGGYYHDLGKIVSPGDFIENQFNDPNPHDRLIPKESAKRIIEHVGEGVRLSAECRIPKMVTKLIPQHHGTQLVEYFFDKALKEKPDPPVRETDFRYPGPKPQSLEAAILMIADAVEAASRTLAEPTRATFDKLVRMIVVKRIADGQFSECDVDTREIEKIVTALVDCLEAMFHSRIRYPWQTRQPR